MLEQLITHDWRVEHQPGGTRYLRNQGPLCAEIYETQNAHGVWNHAYRISTKNMMLKTTLTEVVFNPTDRHDYVKPHIRCDFLLGCLSNKLNFELTESEKFGTTGDFSIVKPSLRRHMIRGVTVNGVYTLTNTEYPRYWRVTSVSNVNPVFDPEPTVVMIEMFTGETFTCNLVRFLDDSNIVQISNTSVKVCWGAVLRARNKRDQEKLEIRNRNPLTTLGFN